MRGTRPSAISARSALSVVSEGAPAGFRRELGLLDSVVVVAGGIIGVGIFANPSNVARVVREPVLILLVWALGGVVALLGAFVWAELASRYPQVGGQYVYLQRAYHPVVGFLYGIALLFIINGGSLAAVSILFASYVDRSFVPLGPIGIRVAAALALVISLPVKYGYAPLRDAIAARYGVAEPRVFPVSGGTSFANWLACAAVLDGCGHGSEVIVERPTYEPLLRIPQALGHRVRRFERRFEDDYAVDLDRFASLVTAKTRLAIVTNLHNPSGARIPMPALRAMASLLARVDAYLLVDEVYLECLFRNRPESCVHAGANVLTTSSLTKAYGLDGLRAGWILGPAALVKRAGRINDLMTNNSVAAGERMTVAAFRHHRDIDRRAHALLDPNLNRLRAFLAREPRLRGSAPDGGNVVFPRLPSAVDSDRLVHHLVQRYSTLVVPGQFFEAPRHIRVSFGCRPARLARGLANISRALDDLS
jgi:aspartate/methionine/tyrosine aminotransferase